MKRVFMTIIVCMAIVPVTRAQGIKEWFSQKKTQTEYLTQQIAALQVYIGYLQKGYKIAKTGLNTIGDIKGGHFKLDQVFFDGLKTINPNVKNYSRVADIITLNIQIVKLSGKAMKAAQASERFNPNELGYTEKVFTHVTNGCNELIDELTQILSPGKLQLSDDERIKRIDGVYAAMKDRYSFINSFCKDLGKLQIQRSRELRDVNTLQKIYGQ
ncbi:hypothetical protein [Niabella ginsenosidivorans]|nr:hypothetical protein [Niabella ginsenosidivorans]